ncbi:hypothetical protein [Achromobacter sp. NFACC18-2]|uniref:hypothetical protein n=1 Tax=Achromobacter sp. NFACC18-2 TaxID=1564112 RepID=UPI0008AD0D99|nr:hypothetical protein [Achromobacter sp. NFACC18-2]SEI78795.1 hypothetical protein SAMN03159494_00998 [Achromobacter sp. NFACC18-2]
MWKRSYRVMQEAGADGGGTGADGSAGNDGAATPPAAPAAAAAPAAPAGSLLKQGEGATEALPQEFIPEKFRVTKEDGAFDLDASARKLADNYANLEKRVGTGDLPPKEVGEYKIEPPEFLAEYKAGEDPSMQAFLADAHKAGLTQGQLDVVMKHHFEGAQKMAQGFQTLDQQQATEQLQQVWGKDEKEFRRNAGLAHAATSAAIERAGLTMEQVEQAGLGNNPVFLRMMSALGAEFQEDAGPGKTSFRSFGEDDVQQLMLSDAYKNPRHPEHEKVSAQVRGYYERKHGTRAVA